MSAVDPERAPVALRNSCSGMRSKTRLASAAGVTGTASQAAVPRHGQGLSPQGLGPLSFLRGTRGEGYRTMAVLDKRRDREAWLKWAIEFARRGIWPSDGITVHGPHGPHAPYMWGDNEGFLDEPDFPLLDVYYRTASGIRGIHDVRGVVIRDQETKNAYPVLPLKNLSPKLRRWLKVAQPLSARLTREAIKEARLYREQREQLKQRRDSTPASYR